MNKKNREVFEAYCKQYHIDLRTMSMVVHHYIDIGERRAETITTQEIDRIYKKEVAEDKAAKAAGKIKIITPDFTAYLLTACMGLAQLDREPRYAIIKEYL